MSHRDKQEVAKVEAPVEAVKPIPPKLVFAGGLCDICGKTMFEHGTKDCRGVDLLFRDPPNAKN